MAAGWSAVQVPGAVIYVRPGQTTLAGHMREMVQSELPRVAQYFGVQSPGPFAIYAYDSYAEFLEATGINPDLRGESRGPTGEIRLYARGDVDSVRRILAHELTHSVLDQRLGLHIGALPTWVNEGLAGHLSEPISPGELPGASRQVHRNGVLSLDELDVAFSSTGSHDAAYLQSRSMVAWLEYRHPGALRRLVDGLANRKSFEDALGDAAQLTPSEWWKQWETNIPAYIYWLNYLSSPVIYAPAAFLVIFVAILRALRKRREAEEEDEVEEPQSGNNEMAHLDEELLEDQ